MKQKFCTFKRYNKHLSTAHFVRLIALKSQRYVFTAQNIPQDHNLKLPHNPALCKHKYREFNYVIEDRDAVAYSYWN